MLAADGKTLTVTGISDVTLDGVAVTVPLTKIRTFTSFIFKSDPVAAILTLDGSYLDFFATNSTVDDGFLAFAGVPGFDDTLFSRGPSFGAFDEDLNRPGYKLTAVAAVPLPAGGLLLLSGLGLLALRRKR